MISLKLDALEESEVSTKILKMGLKNSPKG